MKPKQSNAMSRIKQRASLQGGFTLVEIFIALGILAILVMTAVPNLLVFMQDNRIATQVNRFVGTLHYARSIAVTEQESITICKSSNGTSCQNNVEWEDGWIVFRDDNGNGTLNTNTDTLIRVFDGLQGGNTLRGNNNVTNRLTYTPNGFTSNNGSLIFCDDRGFGENARVVIISNQGRPYTLDADDVNSTMTGCFP